MNTESNCMKMNRKGVWILIGVPILAVILYVFGI